MPAAPTSEAGRRAWWWTVGACTALFLACAAVALDGTPAVEVDVAGWAVALPGATTPVLEVVMQVGTRPAVLVAAVVVGLVLRRWQAGLAVLLAGAAAWAGSSIAKALVTRARPDAELLGSVSRHVAEGWGFPSGHAAISAALAVSIVLVAGGDRRLAVVAGALAALTALARVHVGVHWPLDVVGGAALGVVSALVAVKVVDRP